MREHGFGAWLCILLCVFLLWPPVNAFSVDDLDDVDTDTSDADNVGQTVVQSVDDVMLPSRTPRMNVDLLDMDRRLNAMGQEYATIRNEQIKQRKALDAVDEKMTKILAALSKPDNAAPSKSVFSWGTWWGSDKPKQTLKVVSPGIKAQKVKDIPDSEPSTSTKMDIGTRDVEPIINCTSIRTCVLYMIDGAICAPYDFLSSPYEFLSNTLDGTAALARANTQALGQLLAAILLVVWSNVVIFSVRRVTDVGKWLYGVWKAFLKLPMITLAWDIYVWVSKKRVVRDEKLRKIDKLVIAADKLIKVMAENPQMPPRIEVVQPPAPTGIVGEISPCPYCKSGFHQLSDCLLKKIHDYEIEAQKKKQERKKAALVAETAAATAEILGESSSSAQVNAAKGKGKKGTETKKPVKESDLDADSKYETGNRSLMFVRANIHNTEVKRCLIDTGSEVNILPQKLAEECSIPYTTEEKLPAVVGFDGSPGKIVGKLRTSIRIGPSAQQRTGVDFLVCPSVQYPIIGFPTLHKMGMGVNCLTRELKDFNTGHVVQCCSFTRAIAEDAVGEKAEGSKNG